MSFIIAIQALHAAATLMMTGLIWFVQCVHYPLMGQVGGGNFAHYEREHIRRTTWIVGPLILEAISAVALVVVASQGPARATAIMGAAILVLIWASTIGLQVPCHRRLGDGLDAGTVRRLVATNWVRTILWSIRSAIAVALPLMMQLE